MIFTSCMFYILIFALQWSWKIRSFYLCMDEWVSFWQVHEYEKHTLIFFLPSPIPCPGVPSSSTSVGCHCSYCTLITAIAVLFGVPPHFSLFPEFCLIINISLVCSCHLFKLGRRWNICLSELSLFHPTWWFPVSFIFQQLFSWFVDWIFFSIGCFSCFSKTF